MGWGRVCLRSGGVGERRRKEGRGGKARRGEERRDVVILLWEGILDYPFRW